ncbi:hypothetical protein BDP81DRAFT_320495 [Colletotrichum phormii]|uniref:NACHT domain-containing protein n=1 Tax=Colletotrichum phormii TaxID=359342 RepID=A0AAI9ZSS3_9PEZI|nr:uncharacterized protein BDP81DRAFT_320495 [Colletotrichum phormii]KAK1636348.1 hypothetical protein BDP81DRAFT_320495 [Colletotrichum phormii]
MADPLFITTGVLGFMSFGIEVAQSLYKYYTAVKSQPSNIQHTLLKLQQLEALLEQLRSHIEERQSRPEGVELVKTIKPFHPGTGLWLVRGASFLNWLHHPKSFLWLKGFAGCGKSVLSTTVIEHTLRRRGFDRNSRVGVSFFFLTFNDDTKQSTSALLRALILQLSAQLGSTPTALQRLFQNYRSGAPPDPSLVECIHQILRMFEDVYIIIDALDESPRDSHRGDMLETLTEMRAWLDCSLHLLVTSRDEPDIKDELQAASEDMVHLKNDDIDKDIALFVTEHLERNRRLRKWMPYFAEIETVLVQKAGVV